MQPLSREEPTGLKVQLILKKTMRYLYILQEGIAGVKQNNKGRRT